MANILVLNGPNLNLLGSREPDHYGKATLEDINAALNESAEAAGHTLSHFQSNAEHELVDRVAIPFIEVHLSNVHAREEFRQQSYFSDIAVGVICGLGAQGYQLALEAAIARLN